MKKSGGPKKKSSRELSSFRGKKAFVRGIEGRCENRSCWILEIFRSTTERSKKRVPGGRGYGEGTSK